MKTDPKHGPQVSGRPAPKVRPEREGPVRVELISVGGDLLRGRVSDGNGLFLARELRQHGARVSRITVVDDDQREIAAAVREALERNPQLVFTSGGLGPAEDDRTLAGVADTLGVPLSPNAEAKSQVEAAYQRMARSRLVPTGGIDASREKLYHLPVGATPVGNPHGLAPGVICRLPGGSAVVCLPGKPDELRATLAPALVALRDLAPKGHLAVREVEAPTPDESALRPLLTRLTEEFPEVWVTSRPSSARGKGARAIVVIESVAANADQAEGRVAAALDRLLALVSGAY